MPGPLTYPAYAHTRDYGGRLSATFPDLPDLVVWGDDLDALAEHAVVGLAVYLWRLTREGKPWPQPGRVVYAGPPDDARLDVPAPAQPPKTVTH